MAKVTLRSLKRKLDNRDGQGFLVFPEKTWFWFFGFFGTFLLGVLGTSLYLNSLSKDLPSPDALQAVKPVLATQLLDDKGQPFHKFFVENRSLVPFDSIPQVLIDAVVASEDRPFFSHWGVNIYAIPKAVIRRFRTGRMFGASGITQQLAKNLFLTPERSIKRKLKEAMTAVLIEQTYTKEEILELYFNQVYLGAGCYGFKSASEFYFNTPLQNITPAMAATLAAMLPSPQKNRPDKHPKRSLQKRNLSLGAMAGQGFLTKEEYNTALKAPLIPQVEILKRPTSSHGLYYIEEIRKDIEKRFGQEGLYSEGLTIATSLNQKMQKSLEAAAKEHLSKMQGNLKYRFARRFRFTKHFDKNLDSCVAHFDSLYAQYKSLYKNKKLGWVVDSIHHPRHYPQLQVGAVLLENQSGAIKALMGGKDFFESRFNRATQSLRQPGSSFKPFAFALALQSGMLPADSLVDQPITMVDPNDTSKTWRPANYAKDFEGMVTLRRALYKSKNLPTIQMAVQLGLRNLVRLGRKFGLEHNLPPFPATALGSAEATVMEMTAAYSAFPNGGSRSEPYLIESIHDRNGEEIERHTISKKHVLSSVNAFLMTSMLKDVNVRGTAAKIWSSGFHIPSGGKTGTTNSYTDAWYIGFTQDYTLGIWVGDDRNIMMDKPHTGGYAAVPIWIKTMKSIYQSTDSQPFKVPNGVRGARLCNSANLVYVEGCCQEGPFDYFPSTRVPKLCDVSLIPKQASDNQDYFGSDDEEEDSGIF